jgi:hypothetical protein
MSYSVSIIVPAALRETANKMAEAMGYGPNTYVSPLSASGKEPVTHYGMHTSASAAFVKMLQDVGSGKVPDAPWTDHGLTEADVSQVLGTMKVEIAPFDPNTYWDLVAEQGLQLVETPLFGYGDANIAAALAETGLQAIRPATSSIEGL